MPVFWVKAKVNFLGSAGIPQSPPLGEAMFVVKMYVLHVQIVDFLIRQDSF